MGKFKCGGRRGFSCLNFKSCDYFRCVCFFWWGDWSDLPADACRISKRQLQDASWAWRFAVVCTEV